MRQLAELASISTSDISRIESFKNATARADLEKKNVLLETIEDLEYQNETKEEIMKILNRVLLLKNRDGKF